MFMSDKMENEIKKRLRLDKDGTPYATCPKCHKRIYNVRLPIREYVDYDVSPDFKDGVTYEETDREPDLNNKYEYRCPECNEVLARNEKEVEDLFFVPEHKHKMRA